MVQGVHVVRKSVVAVDIAAAAAAAAAAVAAVGVWIEVEWGSRTGSVLAGSDTKVLVVHTSV